MIKAALLLSIQCELKGQCTESVTNVWKQYIEDISEVMIEGLVMGITIKCATTEHQLK